MTREQSFGVVVRDRMYRDDGVRGRYVIRRVDEVNWVPVFLRRVAP